MFGRKNMTFAPRKSAVDRSDKCIHSVYVGVLRNDHVSKPTRRIEWRSKKMFAHVS